MPFLDLPIDILLLLPDFMDGLDTLCNLQATCKALYKTFESTRPNTVLRLLARRADASRRSSLRQGPPLAHVLALAVAGQVADWAIGSEARTARLRLAFRAGPLGILRLGLEVAGMSLADAKVFCDGTCIAKACILADEQVRCHRCAALDRAAACINQCFQIEDVCSTVRLSGHEFGIEMVYHLAIYGELFHSSMMACITLESDRPRFGADMRRASLVEWPVLTNANSMTILPLLEHAGALRPRPRPRMPAISSRTAVERAIQLGTFRHVLSRLSSNQAWQMKWRTALHAGGILSELSTGPDDAFWMSTMQSCGMAGFELWSNLVTPPLRREREGICGRVRWGEVRNIMVEEVQQCSSRLLDSSRIEKHKGDWPDLSGDIEASLDIIMQH